MADWVGAVVSLLAILGGTAINLFIIGRFVGQWSEAMKNFTAMLKKVEDRVEDVEAAGDRAAGERGTILLRLAQAEEASKVLWKVRDEFVAMRAASEVEDKHSREKLDSVVRSIAVIERQIANLAVTRSSALLTTQEKG